MHAWFFGSWWGDFVKNVFGIEGAVGIPAYGAMMTLAFVCGAVLVLFIYKKFSLKFGQLCWLVVYMAVFGLLGSHVFSLLFRIPEIDFSSWETIKSSALKLFSALMYYGGFLGGLLGLVVFCKKEDVGFYKTGDMILIVLPLCHAIGRVGCFLAGCCYGRHTDGPLGVEFPYGSSVGKVIPTQLFEVGFNLLLFAALLLVYILVYKKGAETDGKRGLICGIYLTAYPVFRFIVEFFRDDTRGTILFLSVSQFISLFLFAYGVYVLVTVSKRLRKAVPSVGVGGQV